jgi:hypothetical protein
MNVFVFKLIPGEERVLIGEYDMAQIPHVGEYFVTRHEAGVQSWPVHGVRHFMTRHTGTQGCFLEVGESEVYEAGPEGAGMIAD